jgi:tetratricopeptide (TPR) repeat protein
MIRSHYTYILLLLTAISLNLSAYNSTDKQVPDDSKLIAFAKQIEQSIESRNPYYFNLSFDREVTLNRILDKSYSEADSAFNEGFIDGIRSTLELGTLIINELGNNGTFRFITSYSDIDGSWIVFRLLSENGINYHAYKVESIDNDFKITDGYFFLSGDKLSEALQLIYDRNTTIFLQKQKMDKVMVRSLDELDKTKQFYSKGNISKAFKIWQEIPSINRTEKPFQYVGLILATGLDKETFLNTYKEYLVNYPEEKGKYLIPLDGLMAHGYYDLALQCLDSVDKAIVKDPLLDFFRAKIYYAVGDIDKATSYLDQVIDLIPDFEMGYLSLLNIYLSERKFEEATLLLNQMILTFNTYKEDLYPFLTDFPDYLNSSLYKEWLEQ